MMNRLLEILFSLIVGVLSFDGKAQVKNECNLEYTLFMSGANKCNVQWLCGVLLEATDSTNRMVSARFDIMRNWIQVDSLEITLQLDTLQLYDKTIRDDEMQTMRYFSSNGLEFFLVIPDFYEHKIPNGMQLSYCHYNFALVVFPKKWRKYQKRFEVFFEK